MNLTLLEVLDATGGSLVHGDPSALVESISTDSRTLQPGEFFLPIVGETFDGHDFLSQVAEKGASGAFVSKTVDAAILGTLPSVVRVEDTTVAFSKIAGYVRDQVSIPVVGITGSNGKTTTKEFTAAVLGEHALKPDASFNNMIGVSKTLLRLDSSHECVVLEMGTNHFGEIASLVAFAKPTVGVFLNVSATHTEFLEDENGIAREKSALPLAAQHAVLNADDPRVIAFRDRCKQVTTFGIAQAADIRARNVHVTETGALSFELEIDGLKVGSVTLPIYGRHHVYNGLAAAAVGHVLGVPGKTIIARLENAKPPKMRVERREYDGVVFFNDAYNANPSSVRAAFRFLSELSVTGRRWVVLGEMAELGGNVERLHLELAAELSPDWCDVFLPLGRYADGMALAAQQSGVPAILRCANLNEAARLLFDLAKPGDTILLKASRRMQLERVLQAYEEMRQSR